jgi:hypothetical protein
MVRVTDFAVHRTAGGDVVVQNELVVLLQLGSPTADQRAPGSQLTDYRNLFRIVVGTDACPWAQESNANPLPRGGLAVGLAAHAESGRLVGLRQREAEIEAGLERRPASSML